MEARPSYARPGLTAGIIALPLFPTMAMDQHQHQHEHQHQHATEAARSAARRPHKQARRLPRRSSRLNPDRPLPSVETGLDHVIASPAHVTVETASPTALAHQPYRLNFGQFRGRTLRECPPAYLAWLLRQRRGFGRSVYAGLQTALDQHLQERSSAASWAGSKPPPAQRPTRGHYVRSTSTSSMQSVLSPPPLLKGRPSFRQPASDLVFPTPAARTSVVAGLLPIQPYSPTPGPSNQPGRSHRRSTSQPYSPTPGPSNPQRSSGPLRIASILPGTSLGADASRARLHLSSDLAHDPAPSRTTTSANAKGKERAIDTPVHNVEPCSIPKPVVPSGIVPLSSPKHMSLPSPPTTPSSGRGSSPSTTSSSRPSPIPRSSATPSAWLKRPSWFPVPFSKRRQGVPDNRQEPAQHSAVVPAQSSNIATLQQHFPGSPPLQELMDSLVERAAVLTSSVITREVRHHLQDARQGILDDLDPMLNLVVQHAVKGVRADLVASQSQQSLSLDEKLAKGFAGVDASLNAKLTNHFAMQADSDEARKELHLVREQFHAARQETHAVREEAHAAREETHAAREETHAARKETHTVRRDADAAENRHRELVSAAEVIHATDLRSACQEREQTVAELRAEIEDGRRRVAIVESERRVVTSAVQKHTEHLQHQLQQKQNQVEQQEALLSKRATNDSGSLGPWTDERLVTSLHEAAAIDADTASFEEAASAAELTRMRTDVRLSRLQSESDMRIQARVHDGLVVHQQRQTAHYQRLCDQLAQTLEVEEQMSVGVVGHAQLQSSGERASLQTHKELQRLHQTERITRLKSAHSLHRASTVAAELRSRGNLKPETERIISVIEGRIADEAEQAAVEAVLEEIEMD
ncbi:hypothetical protein SVAN01_04949 [Stagonosporopsis vannaccii]|nr:hypothetical protein SVAN01_04949 [Stagonosporopsis vannaccii]